MALDGVALMEKGFFHPDRGYWQTVSQPSQAIIDSYPAGTTEVPLKPDADYEWQNGEWVHVPPPEPTPEELRALMTPLTPRQFRDALIDHDIMPDDVTAAIGQIADVKERAKALNAWEYPTQFDRTEPLIEQIGAIFNLTPDDIDDMWQTAMAAPPQP